MAALPASVFIRMYAAITWHPPTFWAYSTAFALIGHPGAAAQARTFRAPRPATGRDLQWGCGRRATRPAIRARLDGGVGSHRQRGRSALSGAHQWPGQVARPVRGGPGGGGAWGRRSRGRRCMGPGGPSGRRSIGPAVHRADSPSGRQSIGPAVHRAAAQGAARRKGAAAQGAAAQGGRRMGKCRRPSLSRFNSSRRFDSHGSQFASAGACDPASNGCPGSYSRCPCSRPHGQCSANAARSD